MKKRTDKILLITFIVLVLTLIVGSTITVQYYCRTTNPELIHLEQID